MKKTALVLTSVAAGALLWLAGKNGKLFPVPSYTVVRVIDGDTFETKEKQLIRLSSANAPELDRCWGEEAKKALEKVILNKPVYLKVQYRDPYDRLISLVYTEEGSVNEQMIRGGHAYYARYGQDNVDSFHPASEEAKTHQRGIYNSECTQKVNKVNPRCQIKGNLRSEKIYYPPGCGTYEQVQVELWQNDQWFCSEEEALKAGYRKAKNC